MPVPNPGLQPLWKRILLRQSVPIALGGLGGPPEYSLASVAIPELQQNLLPHAPRLGDWKSTTFRIIVQANLSVTDNAVVTAGFLSAEINYTVLGARKDLTWFGPSPAPFHHAPGDFVDAAVSYDPVGIDSGGSQQPIWTRLYTDPISSIMEIGREGPGVPAATFDFQLTGTGTLAAAILTVTITWAPIGE
jgi:hypothetical protein